MSPAIRNLFHFSFSIQRVLRVPLHLQFPICGGSQKLFSSSASRRGIYTPEDLPPPGPPTYQPINLRIRGYDFTLVEHYMYYVSRIAHNVGVQKTKRWATPAATSKVTTYKPQSNAVYNDYELCLYERNVQIIGATVPVLSTLLDILNSTLPEGVTVTAKLHEPTDEEVRYVPDYELEALKTQLGQISVPDRKRFQRN